MHMRTEDEGWQKESDLEKKQGLVNRLWLEDRLRRRRGGTSWTRGGV